MRHGLSLAAGILAVFAALSLAATAEPASAAPARAPLAGSIYSYPGVDIGGFCGGTCWEALAFTSKRFVYEGIADSSAIPRCTRVTYDEERDTGCRRYRVSGDAHTVTIGGERWRLNRARTKLSPAGEGTSLFLSPYPRPGARYAAALTSISTFGAFPNSTVSVTYLTLDRDGRFALSGSIVGSIGAPGAIETHFAASSPEERGRYEFLRRGSLRLSFEDDTVKRHASFLLYPKGKPTIKDGLYVGGRMYLPPDEDD